MALLESGPGREGGASVFSSGDLPEALFEGVISVVTRAHEAANATNVFGEMRQWIIRIHVGWRSWRESVFEMMVPILCEATRNAFLGIKHVLNVHVLRLGMATGATAFRGGRCKGVADTAMIGSRLTAQPAFLRRWDGCRWWLIDHFVATGSATTTGGRVAVMKKVVDHPVAGSGEPTCETGVGREMGRTIESTGIHWRWHIRRWGWNDVAVGLS
jgi:hypothetical protein